MEEHARQFPIDAIDALEDCRSVRNQLHSQPDIIFLTICVVVYGADSWTEVENFGEMKLEWLRKYVSLANRIPFHNTLGRFFAMLEPEKFEVCFKKWIAGITNAVGGEAISIDGKTLSGPYDKYFNTW